MLREHFPGDLAVYISHSNSFCAQYLPLPLARSLSRAPPPPPRCVSLVPLRVIYTKSGLNFICFNHVAAAERTLLPSLKTRSAGCLFKR